MTNAQQYGQQITVIPAGLLRTNCTLLSVPGSGILYIFDPAGEGKRLIREANRFEGINEVRIVLTHAHFDHIQAAGEVAAAFGLDKLYLHPADHALYYSPENAMEPYFTAAKNLPQAAWPPPPDDNMQIIPCPGHTPGGSSFYFKSLSTVVTGDTLFYECIGRTDFPGGNFKDLENSVRNGLFVLPDDTRVIPGHECETTIGHEKKHNPYV